MSEFPPIPGSAFFLDHLLGLLFIAHILCMNFVAIAPLVIGWYVFAKGERGLQRAQWTGAALPVAYTLAINFGVACLLFVQVLFPDKFFTANILIGNRWIAVIGLLLISFYGVYVVNSLLSSRKWPLWVPGALSLVNGLLVWIIGYTMIANYFVSTNSALWPLYQQDPGMVRHTPTLLPRSLHYIVGATAVTGMWMIWIARWRRRQQPDSEELSKYGRQGHLLAAAATGIQIIVGIWYLLSLPATMWDKLFSGGFAPVVWISGVAAGILLLVVLAIGILLPSRARSEWTATLLLFWTLVGMVSGRELIRQQSFSENFKLRELSQTDASGVQSLFLFVLLAGIITILWLIAIVRRAK